MSNGSMDDGMDGGMRLHFKTAQPLPGMDQHSPHLFAKFKAELKQKNQSYHPRTRHLAPDGQALFTNRLFLQKSPYLLQHAHNPVNWYPWEEEAFKEARKKNLPVLLSVGYSTCHWCHVMEEESFEDLEIARYMNQNYIAVKVDREERPDVDSVYMSAVQLITGQGGWPMTVWLTPDKQVFFGGTYFPAHTGDRGARMGFLSLLQELSKAYKEKQSEIVQTGANINQALQKALSPPPGSAVLPGKEVGAVLREQALKRVDLVYGGMKGAPKFPSSFPVRALLRLYPQDQDILRACRLSLDGMQKGGMRDHIGGGFHRYSTDERWLIPHFEKMLYDQALLSLTYLEAHHLFKEKSYGYDNGDGDRYGDGYGYGDGEGNGNDYGYGETAREILDYVIRDMRSPEGGFYSATDAVSLSPVTKKKEEGFYFTWTPAEIDKALDKDQALLVKAYYGVTTEGNFEGRNVLHLTKDLSEVLKTEPVKKLNLSAGSARALLDQARKTLYKERGKRPLPLRDEKMLSGWNGLMISALVYGYVVLNDRRYLELAREAGKFILSNMYKDRQLYRSYKEGRAYIPAYLDDYVFVMAGLLDLFEWTGEIEWLKKVVEMDQVLQAEFEDNGGGGSLSGDDVGSGSSGRGGGLSGDDVGSGSSGRGGGLSGDDVGSGSSGRGGGLSGDDVGSGSSGRGGGLSGDDVGSGSSGRGGGFFMTGRNYEMLPAREKPFYDGAEPSGNSIALMNLLRLGEWTGDPSYRARGEKLLTAFGRLLKENPVGFSTALLAVDYYLSRVYEIVLVLPNRAGHGAKRESDPFFVELKSRYLPRKVLTVVHAEEVEEWSRLLQPVKRKTAVDGKTTAYICEAGACLLPALDIEELRQQLNDIQKSNGSNPVK